MNRKFDSLGHATKSPVVNVMIAADTGDLLHLRQEDDSYSRRPFCLIKDMDKLLAIPDAEFLKYTPAERSNLVARFSAVTYPGLTNEPYILILRTNAPAGTNVFSSP